MDTAVAQAEQQHVFTPPAGMTSPLSERDAAAYVTTTAELPSIRTLAAQWGWHRSKVERFLKRPEFARVSPLKIETATETLIETAHNTTLVPLVEKPPPEPDCFASDSPDLIQVSVPCVAVYVNVMGTIVIRAEAGPYDDEDLVITIAPASVPALIRRLEKLCVEIRGRQQ